jgi:hypothetical protein
MPTEGVTPLTEAIVPAGTGADRRGLVQQPGPLLPGGQAGELRPPRVVGQQERLLAVQDRRVRARGAIAALDLAGWQIERVATASRRIGL